MKSFGIVVDTHLTLNSDDLFRIAAVDRRHLLYGIAMDTKGNTISAALVWNHAIDSGEK